jgi:peptidoglycan/LPS O-acetylase OafA/YrhL
MLPEALKEFSDSLIAVPAFASNFLFFKETRYFALSALEKPLLHTWSLAVEEQYYVLFPLFIILFYRFGRRNLAALFAAGLIASLCLSEYLLQHKPTANFYFAPPRAWELLAGALLALAAAERPLYERFGGRLAQILSLTGLASIGVSVFVYDAATPFPGLYAIPPALGAALVLGFAHRGTLAGRILSLPPVAGAGLLSYSLYLWHQPLFAFARLYSINAPPPAMYLALCAASFALAYLTWRLVENPLRDKEKFSRRQIFAGATVISCAFIALGAAGHFAKGFPQRFTPAQLAVYQPAESKLESARYKDIPGLKELRYAPLGAPDVPPDTVLYGDSHAQALGRGLSEALRQRRRAAIFLGNHACESIPNMYSSIALDRIDRDCPGWQQKLLDYIKADAHIRNIVVVMRWTYRLYPIRGAVESLTYDNGEGGIESDDYREYYALDENGRFTQDGEAKSRTVRAFLNGLASTGKRVIVLYPIPEAGWNIPQLAYKNMMRGRYPETVSTSYERFLVRNKYADALLDSVHAPNLVKIRPADALCNVEIKGRCTAQLGDTPLYFDDDHLSAAGAERVVRQIMAELR